MFRFLRRRSDTPRQRFHGFYIGRAGSVWLGRELTEAHVGTIVYIMDNCAMEYLETQDLYQRFRGLWSEPPANAWLAWDDASVWLVDAGPISAAGERQPGENPGLHLFLLREREISHAWVSSKHFPADTGLPAPLRSLVQDGREWRVQDDEALTVSRSDLGQRLADHLVAQHQQNTNWLAAEFRRLDESIGVDAAGPRDPASQT